MYIYDMPAIMEKKFFLILIAVLFICDNSFAQSDIDNILYKQKNDIDYIISKQQSFVDDMVGSLKHPFDKYNVREMKVDELQRYYGGEYDIDWGKVIAKFGVGATIIVVTGTIGVVAGIAGLEPISAIAFASAKGAAQGCVEGAVIGGGLSVLIDGLMNNDVSSAKKSLIEGAADGCMWGAAIGAVTGGWGKYKIRKAKESAAPPKNEIPPKKDCVIGANGNCRINSKYAGEAYKFPNGSELARKYPEGVPFDEKGFPRFEKYAKKEVKFKNPFSVCGKSEVCIAECVKKGECLSFNSSRGGPDFRMANKKAGLEYTPEGWTWHHVDAETIILVPQDLHNAVRHTGAVSEYWNGL